MVLRQAMPEFVLTLWAGPRGQFVTILGPENEFIFINYIRTLRFMWDLALVLFDSIKAIVFRKILPFGNIFCFPGENRSQKWTKTVNFGYIPFSPKDIILKDCSKNQFFGPILTNSLQQNKNCQMSDALHCIALLFKVSK